MKTTALSTILVLFLISCQSVQDSNFESFGEIISEKNALDLQRVKGALSESDSIQTKLVATIDEVCQMKGCWMTLKTADGVPVRVTFKDYGFFVPKDAAGKKVIVQGVVSQQEMDRATAEHYAEDAGKELAPDASLTEISVVASGVLIEKEDQL